MSVVAEKFTEANLLQQVDIVVEREGNLVEAFVPISLINQEEVPYDQEHVEELALSIKKESEKQNTTGQLSAVLLAEVPELDRFVIIDGFHRVPALGSLGKKEVYATIKPDCTWEDVVDLRIVAAKSHKSVKFARIVEWVEEAWQRTPWSQKINSSSAFQLYFLNNTGSRSGVTQEEATEIREWVERKCEQWDISAPAVDRFLRTARMADPELVKIARERKSGHKLEAITPKHLSAIVQFLPNKHALQRLVADTAVVNMLTVPQTRALALAISKENEQEKIDQLVGSRIWENMDVGKQALIKSRHRNIDPNKPESYVSVLLDKFFDDQVAVAQLLIENAILTGSYTPRQDVANGRVNSLVIEADLPSDIEELPENERVHWEPEKINEVAANVVALNGLLSGFLARRFGLNYEDREDVISTATIRFLTRVSDGRLPQQYAEREHLQRLILKFVGYAAIDHIRSVRGRNGDKPIMVSIDAENEDGLSLKDRLGDTEPEESFEITGQNAEFIKSMLPHLNERERRVLVLKGYFNLTCAEIGQIIGTTEGTVYQSFRTCKQKVLKLADDASISV